MVGDGGCAFCQLLAQLIDAPSACGKLKHLLKVLGLKPSRKHIVVAGPLSAIEKLADQTQMLCKRFVNQVRKLKRELADDIAQ